MKCEGVERQQKRTGPVVAIVGAPGLQECDADRCGVYVGYQCIERNRPSGLGAIEHHAHSEHGQKTNANRPFNRGGRPG